MKRKLTNTEISDICFELSLLLHSGTGTADSLYILSDDTEDGEIKKVLKNMANTVDEGKTLDNDFRTAEVFPDYVANLIEVGEKTGRTEESLSALSDYYQEQDEMGRRIKSSLLYPSILMLVMLAVLVVLLVYVLPIFNGVYAQLGSRLSGVAGGLLTFGKILRKCMPVLCVLLGTAVVFCILFATNETFQSELTAKIRKNNGNKGITKKITTARFAEAFAMGVASGMPTEDAVALAGKTVSDVKATHKQLEDCMNSLNEGNSIPDALSSSGLLPKTECRIIASAIKSGETEKALQRVAEKLSGEANEALSDMIGRIEPTLVIVGCVLVGAILLCVMLPLINIMSVIG